MTDKKKDTPWWLGKPTGITDKDGADIHFGDICTDDDSLVDSLNDPLRLWTVEFGDTLVGSRGKPTILVGAVILRSQSRKHLTFILDGEWASTLRIKKGCND